MRIIIRSLMLVLILVILGMPTVLCADEPTPPPSQPDVRMLAEEVDVLQLIADMNLTEKQITYISDSVTNLTKKREEFRKKEEALLQEIKEPLQKIRDALAAGKEVPGSAESIASAKKKELQSIRLQMWKDFQSAVKACIQLLDEGQIRRVKRSPEAITRATQMIQRIRSASEQNPQKTLDEITSILLEVRKYDKQEEWQTKQDELQNLTGEEKDKALKDFENKKDAEITQMRIEINQTLMAYRNADPRLLSVAVNNLASALRTKAGVQMQLQAMMGRILDSPGAATALKARLESMKNVEHPPPNVQH